MFESSIEMDEEGVTIPYAPLFDNVRLNHGFVDTRGRPDLAASIVECAQSSAMRALLVQLAQPGAKIFSVGCDIGTKCVTGEETPYYTAGGYVQIMKSDYVGRSPREYARFGEAVAEMLRVKSCGHEWRLNLTLTPVQFNLDEFRDLTGSLWIWFHALGDSKRYAVASRETYIVNLTQCLLDEENLACFE